MNVKSFSAEDLQDQNIRDIIKFNPTYIFLLPKDIENFAEVIENLIQDVYANQRNNIRFAYEINYPCPITLDNIECHSLSETLGKIDNLPTQKISLIVPDEFDAQCLEELCRQMFLLQIPFEIQNESYKKFTANSEKFFEELTALKEICNGTKKFYDETINLIVKDELISAAENLEQLLKPTTPSLWIMSDENFLFEMNLEFPVNHKENFSPENKSPNDGLVFLLNDSNPENVQQLNKYAKHNKKNILVILKSNENFDNVSLYLANTANFFKQQNHAEVYLTLVGEDENLTENLIRSFYAYLNYKAWNIGNIKNQLGNFNEIFQQTENNVSKFWDDLRNVENEQFQYEKLHAEIKFVINNETLLFYDVLPKSLLYDSQQIVKTFWNEFRKKCHETLDKLTTDIYFSDEKILHEIYKGDMPKEILLFLQHYEGVLNELYNSMEKILLEKIFNFFSNRISDFIRLLPTNLINVEFDEERFFELHDNSFSGCLIKIFSGNQLTMLVRRNSKILSLKDFPKSSENIVFLETNLRIELRRLLEIEFNKKETSVETRLDCKIHSAIKNSWLKIGEVIHNQVETTKKNFSSSVEKNNTKYTKLQEELLRYLSFLKEIQIKTRTLLMYR